ncbi:MAG: FkbM family methyltransferase [Roseibium sp.]|uniref:FkbM family methyltransferase n=1 Tax=Roseibium sp. TaxID=1936156 RepID=UPI00262C0944|nr:FkbM family methyltransferase [Roseibium sp.]MCV0425430.1 FkbM family methyltransferase [Roseibium sp.]
MGIRKSLRKKLLKRGNKVPYLLMNDDEKYLHRVLSMIGPEDTVIDLGAHVGKISRKFAERAKTVYSFEPHPEIFRTLQDNTKEFPNITTFQKAVSDTSGTAKLFSDPSMTTRPTQGSTLSDGKSDVSYENSYEVQLVHFSKFVQDLDCTVKLIKVDIEGMEYRIINDLIDSNAISRVEAVYVEDHCGIIGGLEAQRDATLEKIKRLNLGHKFNFDWP